MRQRRFPELNRPGATLKRMIDDGKGERITFACNKDAAYSYHNVLRLMEAVYSEIGKANPFDLGYKHVLKSALPGASSMTNDELMRQS